MTVSFGHSGGYLNNHYEFVGVGSCQEVLSLYVLIWVLTLLNLLAFILGILTTAVLGSIKDMVRTPRCMMGYQSACSHSISRLPLFNKGNK